MASMRRGMGRAGGGRWVGQEGDGQGRKEMGRAAGGRWAGQGEGGGRGRRGHSICVIMCILV